MLTLDELKMQIFKKHMDAESAKRGEEPMTEQEFAEMKEEGMDIFLFAVMDEYADEVLRRHKNSVC